MSSKFSYRFAFLLRAQNVIPHVTILEIVFAVFEPYNIRHQFVFDQWIMLKMFLAAMGTSKCLQACAKCTSQHCRCFGLLSSHSDSHQIHARINASRYRGLSIDSRSQELDCSCFRHFYPRHRHGTERSGNDLFEFIEEMVMFVVSRHGVAANRRLGVHVK